MALKLNIESELSSETERISDQTLNNPQQTKLKYNAYQIRSIFSQSKQIELAVKQNDQLLTHQEVLDTEIQQDSLFYDQNERQELLKNNNIDPFQESKRALLHRKILRICLLVVIEIIVIGLFMLFYYKYGFSRGRLYIKDNQSLTITMNNCILKINDYYDGITSQEDLNFLSIESVPSSIDDNILLVYTLPNPQYLGEESSVSTDEEKLNITFNNQIDYQQCEIALYVYKETTLKSLTIDCDRSDCFIIQNSKKLRIESLVVEGQNAEFNSSYLNAQNINILTFSGSVEMNNVKFNTAVIEASSGDISIQSTQTIKATLEMTKKLYCASTFSALAIEDTVVEKSPQDCIDVSTYKPQNEDQKNVIARRCLIGDLTVKSNVQDQQQLLVAKNTFGNIFINVLEKEGASAYYNSNQVYDKTLYGDQGDSIDLSDLSKQRVAEEIQLAKNPKVFDPVFLIIFGSQQTTSSTFTQWQITYNPAYSYLKPWWLGTLSYTILTTQLYNLHLNIAPGFCPYVPALSKDRIFKTQELISKIFQNESVGKKIISFAWQETLKIPLLQFANDNSYSGIREIDLQTDYLDSWYNFTKDDDGTIVDDSYILSKNPSLVVSIILAVIVGFLFMLLIIFLINKNYLYLLDYMHHVDTYSQIKSKQNDVNNEIEINPEEKTTDHAIEMEEDQQAQTKEIQELDQLRSKDQRVFKYSISSIFNLLYTIVYLSPPLSAYIDQVVLLFYKAYTNSINRFYGLLFTVDKVNNSQNSNEIHDLQKDTIDGKELKELYEQFCYLNRLLERKIDDQANVKILNQFGFKITLKQDTLISYFGYIKYTGFKTVIQTEETNSLNLFVHTCCQLTKFDCDMIDSLNFEQYYYEFCNKNHLMKEQLNERKLKRDFGIETRLIPQQVIERNPQYNITTNTKYNIDRERVKNNFQLLLKHNSEDQEQYQQTDNQDKEALNRSFVDIYQPTRWYLYDLLTVCMHLVFITFMGIPLIALVIFVRVQESQYTLIPTTTQIYLNDIIYNFSVIPTKLMSDNKFVQFIAVLSLIFWALCSWDLLYYYKYMSFPQERYFQNYRKSKWFRKVVTRFMWVVVLLAIYIIVIYIFLTLTWLILGAIINPDAFLPYASSAATLITLITTKYQEYKQLSENGFQIITEYIKSISEKQFSSVLKKMNITDSIAGLVPTNQIKSLVGEAAKLKLIDDNLSNEIQNNLELMVRDPKTMMFLGKQIYDIAQDPRQYAQNLMTKVENKVKESLSQQVSQYLPKMGESLIQTIEHLLMKEKQLLKGDLMLLFRDLISEVEDKGEDFPNKEQFIKEITIFKGPILQLLFDIQFPEENDQVEDIKAKILQNFCSLLSILISFKKDDPPDEEQLESSVTVKEDFVKKSKRFQVNAYSQMVKKGFGDEDNEEVVDEEDEEQKIREKQKSRESKIEEEQESEVCKKIGQTQTKTDWKSVIYDQKNLKELNDIEKIEIIMSYILKIYKNQKYQNLNELLSEILKLLNDEQIPKGTGKLNSLSCFNDVFNIIVELNEKMGIVNIDFIEEKVKLFFEKNYSISSENEEKSQISNLTQYLFMSILCHMQCKENQDITTIQEELRQIENTFNNESLGQDEQKDKAQEDNILTQQGNTFSENQNLRKGILPAYYLLWIQGCTTDIPINSIKQLLQDLVSVKGDEFIAFKKLQDIIINTNLNKSVRVQAKLKNTQSLITLTNILMSNPMNDMKKQKKNAQRIFGINEKFKQFLPSALKIKFKHLSTSQDYKLILESDIFQQISLQLKLSNQLLIGLLHIINNNIFSKEAIITIKIIFVQNKVSSFHIFSKFIQSSILIFQMYFFQLFLTILKVSDKWVIPFLNLYGLFTSENENDMNTYLNYFQFSKMGYSIQKKQPQTQKIISIHAGKFQEYFCLILLKLKGKYNTIFQKRVAQAFLKLFGTEIKEEQLKKSTHISSLFSQFTKQNDDLLKSFMSFALTESQSIIKSNILSQILKIFSNNLPGNTFNGIQKNEIDVFSQILSLRNIQNSSTEIQSQLIKDSMNDISHVLNVDEYLIQNFFYLFTSNNQQRIINSLQVFGYEKLEDDSYIKFISSCARQTLSIQNKWIEIGDIQNEFFIKKIPLNFLRDLLLFNQVTSDSESSCYIFDIFFKEMDPKIKQLFKFKYNINSEYNIQQLVQTFTKSICSPQQQEPNQPNNNPKLPKGINSEINPVKGIEIVMSILSNFSSQNQNIQLLLQFFYDSKQDLQLLFACLWVYFSGESDNVTIQIDKKIIVLGKKQKTNNEQVPVSIEQYLSHRLSIKQEFFQAIPSLFFSNTYSFVSQFIKFYRQADYQYQLKRKAEQQEEIISTQYYEKEKSIVSRAINSVSNKFSSKSKKTKLDENISQKVQTKTNNQNNSIKLISSINRKDNNNENNNAINDNNKNNTKGVTRVIKNCFNRITVFDKEVEQFIRLLSGNTINTAFFSRELGIPIDIIELVSCINSIKRCQTKEERSILYDQMVLNNQVLKIFQQIGVQVEEFITCCKFFYKDFEVEKQKSLQKELKMPLEFPYSILQSILLLDVYLPIYDDPLINAQKLNNALKANQIIKDMSNNQIDFDLISLLFSLYGDFTVMRTYFAKDNLSILQTSNKSFINIVIGLIGQIKLFIFHFQLFLKAKLFHFYAQNKIMLTVNYLYYLYCTQENNFL